MAEPVLSDIFNFSRLLGLFPLDSNFLLSKKWMIYAILFRLITVVFDVIGITARFRLLMTKQSRDWDVFVYIDVFDRFTAFLRHLFTAIYFVRSRNSILKLSNSIEPILTWQGKTKYPFCFTRNCLAFITCLILVPLFVNREYPFIMSTMFRLMLLINFTSTASIVGHIWDLMRVLTTLVCDNDASELESSIDALENWTSLGEAIGEIYGPLMLMVVASCFPRLIMDLYLLLLQLYPDRLFLNFVVLMSAFLGFFFVSSILYSCNKFVDQINEFNNKLLWKIINDQSGRYFDNEKLNFHFTAYKAVKFTACGFFNMDYSLISSMISVCTTYLVIVLQYGKSSASET